MLQRTGKKDGEILAVECACSLRSVDVTAPFDDPANDAQNKLKQLLMSQLLKNEVTRGKMLMDACATKIKYSANIAVFFCNLLRLQNATPRAWLA